MPRVLTVGGKDIEIGGHLFPDRKSQCFVNKEENKK